MEVFIHGPNLKDQSKGQFHIHTVDCPDNKFYGPNKKYGGVVDNIIFRATNRKGIVMFLYPPEEFDYDPKDWADFDDLWIAPCVKGLKQ